MFAWVRKNKNLIYLTRKNSCLGTDPVLFSFGCAISSVKAGKTSRVWQTVEWLPQLGFGKDGSCFAHGSSCVFRQLMKQQDFFFKSRNPLMEASFSHLV